jgi:hypothetical protein
MACARKYLCERIKQVNEVKMASHFQLIQLQKRFCCGESSNLKRKNYRKQIGFKLGLKA